MTTSELLHEGRDAFHALMAEVELLPADALDNNDAFPFLGGKSLAEVLPGNGHLHHREHLLSLIRGLRAPS